MASNWVDFKAVKAGVSMTAVLDRYQVNWLREKGDELRGRCPIHQGEGQDTFHVSVSKNAFHCFSCKARGNVLDLVAAMEECSVRDAAVKLADWFSLSTSEVRSENGRANRTAQPENRGLALVENKALTFELKNVDPHHAYLQARGITPETAKLFGVGFFSGRGSMSGRVVIPIHNEKGELVAYAGRVIDGSEPKYKLPAGFHKSHELFNLHRAIGDSNAERRVVIVEGFFDCLKVHQAGFPALALMGCSLSQVQEDLIVRHFKTACVLLDGDEAGQQAAGGILTRLGRRMWVWAPVLPKGKQPDMLSSEELAGLLEK